MRRFCYQEVKAVDEKTVTITTIAQRDLEFISYLTSAIIPKGYTMIRRPIVSTGPFMYVSRSRRKSRHQRLTITGDPRAYLDKVTYKIYEKRRALVTA